VLHETRTYRSGQVSAHRIGKHRHAGAGLAHQHKPGKQGEEWGTHAALRMPCSSPLPACSLPWLPPLAITPLDPPWRRPSTPSSLDNPLQYASLVPPLIHTASQYPSPVRLSLDPVLQAPPPVKHPISTSLYTCLPPAHSPRLVTTLWSEALLIPRPLPSHTLQHASLILCLITLLL
jgi:hypothetical protein